MGILSFLDKIHNTLTEENMADHTQELRQLMKEAGISSFRNLSDRSEVSLNTITKLRCGQADLIYYKDLDRLANCLKVAIAELISKFSDLKPQTQNLQIAQSELLTKLEFQQDVLIKLESMLLQLPTVVYAISKNPDLPARNLLPLLRPLDNLLQDWGIEAIATVGSEVDYNPKLHQLMGSESIQAGDRVLVRYTGYVKGDQLLYRARVSSIKEQIIQN